MDWKIVLDFPLTDMMQLSPEFSKALRPMPQRIVVCKPKRNQRARRKLWLTLTFCWHQHRQVRSHIMTINDPTMNISAFFFFSFFQSSTRLLDDHPELIAILATLLTEDVHDQPPSWKPPGRVSRRKGNEG
ncbi:uncharacterized protein LY79DRAFT_545357 [Colletotrichum navitas]|uniref:Uncharacterized protein n=1 Tax=Colletotrichum navitas TaxID=681940 RepID=A0AAD8V6I7_9PEZI|nr:uncharacterized protein LY79DRAFT_545357 [Colletotrichum navitas]KAK1596087.1 hypothetical protein LY79DRAFT_545357 [Colletotrichum navitas]